jgi:hypothetical protein
MAAMDESERSHHRALWLIAALLALIPLGWLAWQAKIVRYRRAMREQIEASGGLVIGSEGGSYSDSVEILRVPVDDPSVPWIRQLIGDDQIQAIVLRSGHSDVEDEATEAFPEAPVYALTPASAGAP